MNALHLLWIVPLSCSFSFALFFFSLSSKWRDNAYERMCENSGGKPRDQPRKYYTIHDNGDGTADVYLIPSFTAYKTDIGIDKYDIDVRVVKGIIPWDGMEDDIRARYYDWLDSAEVIDL